jgi:iron complex transport system ATP-binding protein
VTERGTPLISARDLHLGYRSSPEVLRDANAEVRAGELLCIIGPNGGGKTTLVRSLAGLLPPRHGTVELAGVSLYGRRALDRRQRAQTIAVVLTHTVAPAYLRVHELVELGRLPYRRMRHTDVQVVSRVLAQSGITQLADRPVGELSDGERQRVMVARALAQEPKILLLDEPAVHLDPPHQSELFLLLGGLVREGIIESVAIATHLLHLALHFSDRILLVADGGVVPGNASELLADGRLEAAFAGPSPAGNGTIPLVLDADRGWFLPAGSAQKR